MHRSPRLGRAGPLCRSLHSRHSCWRPPCCGLAPSYGSALRAAHSAKRIHSPPHAANLNALSHVIKPKLSPPECVKVRIPKDRLYVFWGLSGLLFFGLHLKDTFGFFWMGEGDLRILGTHTAATSSITARSAKPVRQTGPWP